MNAHTHKQQKKRIQLNNKTLKNCKAHTNKLKKKHLYIKKNSKQRQLKTQKNTNNGNEQ